ncbi:TPA: hypothetical protein HA244_06525 [Candidatus Micrarchaeota archaeon]|nr:hypothetical protein [Candidatus Micrarchaeota archaeon]
MSFFDSLFGKKEVVTPYMYGLECSFHPFRLRAHTKDAVDLEIRLRNNTDQELLSALVVVLPHDLGFEQIGLQQEHESRLGLMKPGEERFIKIPVWSNQKTPPGSYKVKIFAISHYRDYSHVLNEVKRTMELRVA